MDGDFIHVKYIGQSMGDITLRFRTEECIYLEPKYVLSHDYMTKGRCYIMRVMIQGRGSTWDISHLVPVYETTHRVFVLASEAGNYIQHPDQYTFKVATRE